MNKLAPDPNLVRAWGGTVELPTKDGIMRIDRVEMGAINIRSGRLVACDPLMFGDPEPFDIPTPIGWFPVRLLIVEFDIGDQRIASASVNFSAAESVHWEMAVTEDQNVATLEPGFIFGYPIDSGTGSYMDVVAAAALEKRMTEQEDYYRHIISEMDKTYKHTRSWAMIDLDDQRELNAAVFSSGVGDGIYASYWGYDADGALASLMTDFGLFDASHE